jgi:hypothetical protein
MKKKSSISLEEKKMDGWLTGWKEIGHYMGFDEKTVIKYFKKHRLPIIRMPSTNKPIALPRRLDEWLENFKKN